MTPALCATGCGQEAERCSWCRGRGMGAYLTDYSGLDDHCPKCNGTGTTACHTCRTRQERQDAIEAQGEFEGECERDLKGER